jgi:hypothetical protein
VSRPLVVGTALLCVVAVLLWITSVYFWLPALALALLCFALARKSPRWLSGRAWLGGAGSGSGFLCDRCKYNDARYCRRPERPNATSCPDFKAQ